MASKVAASTSLAARAQTLILKEEQHISRETARKKVWHARIIVTSLAVGTTVMTQIALRPLVIIFLVKKRLHQTISQLFLTRRNIISFYICHPLIESFPFNLRFVHFIRVSRLILSHKTILMIIIRQNQVHLDIHFDYLYIAYPAKQFVH